MLITKKELDYLTLLGNTKIEISLDLGVTKSEVTIKDSKVTSPFKLDLTKLRKLKDNTIYTVENEELKPLEFYSDETRKFYKLVPTKDWPTVTISSTPMHKVNFSSPKQDTMAKMNAVGEIKGKALDTCMGAGYTAIQLSKICQVDTFEIDDNMIEIAKLNPFSKELFEGKIKVHNADIFEEIQKFDSDTFDIIIHDPPTFKYAHLLYSSEFYEHLFRILKKDGRIYHYTPMPGVKSGRDFPKEVEKRLQAAGFWTEWAKEAQGFVLTKALKNKVN